MERASEHRHAIGNRVAPPRFLLFVAATLAGLGFAIPQFGPRLGIMAGFDFGAAVFLLVCLPLLGRDSSEMRRSAKRNDARRVLLLLVTAAVMLVVLASVASVLAQRGAPHPPELAVVMVTLALCWTFTTTVFGLHYAHLYYSEAPDGTDARGLEFPGTDEPDYWDFVYFAFCLGMTSQTSDVGVTQSRMRRPVTLQSLAAFVFNLGVLAFTINVIGS
ncbi:DUF1345 domain-containing protein [Sphingomonas sp. DT-207]|uniref:DUF1345 domain-containing protein n=1 Tax=Sphingomonas sp. DT-207 TaxID=3396167 RepID=UPI003F19D69C